MSNIRRRQFQPHQWQCKWNSIIYFFFLLLAFVKHCPSALHLLPSIPTEINVFADGSFRFIDDGIICIRTCIHFLVHIIYDYFYYYKITIYCFFAVVVVDWNEIRSTWKQVNVAGFFLCFSFSFVLLKLFGILSHSIPKIGFIYHMFNVEWHCIKWQLT